MANTQYIDLDAVVPDRQIVVKLDGKDHPLVPVTLEAFCKNTRKIQALELAGDDIENNLELILEMLSQAFPSLTVERLRKLTFPQLKQLQEVAMQNDGREAVEEDAAKANPQPAG